MAVLDQNYETGADQEHNFRYNVGNNEHAQGFKPTYSDVTSVSLYLKKVASPTGNIYVQIQSDSAGKPSNISLGQSANIDVSTLSTSFAWIDFTFSTPVSVAPSTQYHIVLFGTFAIDGINWVRWDTDGSSPTYTDGSHAYRGTGAWTTDTSYDNYFRTYATPRPSTFFLFL